MNRLFPYDDGMSTDADDSAEPSRHRFLAYQDVDVELASRALASEGARFGSGSTAILAEPITAELPTVRARRLPVLPVFGGVLALFAVTGAVVWLDTTPARPDLPPTVVVSTPPVTSAPPELPAPQPIPNAATALDPGPTAVATPPAVAVTPLVPLTASPVTPGPTPPPRVPVLPRLQHRLDRLAERLGG